MSDLIDREQAKDAIDKYLVGRNLVTDGTFMARLINEIVIDRLPSAQPTFDARDTQYNLPIGTDLISRADAIEAVQNRHMMLSKEKVLLINDIKKLPPAQPYTIHSDGRLWITVDDIDKVTAVVVDEHKSKFCKQFYEDAEPEYTEEDIRSAFNDGFRCGQENMEQAIKDAQPEPSQVARDIARIVENEQDMRILPKRGKWIRDGHHIRCDQCGMYMCDTDREGDRIPTEFCPHCGADMREVTI